MSDDRTLSTVETQVEKPKSTIAMSERGVNFQSFEDLYRFCVAVHKSQLAPSGFESPEAIMVAVQHGLELGLPPLQALQSIAVINKRPCLWGDAALALAMSKPDFEDIEEVSDANGATCTIKRKGRTPVTRTFTIADAAKAGLDKKSGPWTQYPKRMLQLRARSWALRDSFPDALRGVSIREEQQDVPPKQATVRVVEGIKFADETPQSRPEQLTLEAGQ